MGWYEELKQTLGTANRQIIQPGRPKPRDLHFTTKFQQIARLRGLSEQDARDVYYHGSVIKPNMMVKKYNGYELGIWFFNDKVTGQAIITSIWKRGRR